MVRARISLELRVVPYLLSNRRRSGMPPRSELSQPADNLTNHQVFMPRDRNALGKSAPRNTGSDVSKCHDVMTHMSFRILFSLGPRIGPCCSDARYEWISNAYLMSDRTMNSARRRINRRGGTECWRVLMRLTGRPKRVN